MPTTHTTPNVTLLAGGLEVGVLALPERMWELTVRERTALADGTPAWAVSSEADRVVRGAVRDGWHVDATVPDAAGGFVMLLSRHVTT